MPPRQAPLVGKGHTDSNNATNISGDEGIQCFRAKRQTLLNTFSFNTFEYRTSGIHVQCAVQLFYALQCSSRA